MLNAEGLPFAVTLGLGFVIFGLLTGPWGLRVQGRWSALLPGRHVAGLREHVDELTTSRAEAREDAAAELRRNEQEVHDGTQSQLVAIVGMKLGAAARSWCLDMASTVPADVSACLMADWSRAAQLEGRR